MAATAANPRCEKVQNLPLLCVETILKFTPTAKMIRLCSNTVPLPGPFWSFGLEAVLKKRLPLSLRDDLPRCWPDHSVTTTSLLDATGAKIATVKNTDEFRCCPLREYIESATLTVRLLPKRRTVEPLQSSVVHGDALLSQMPNVLHLALVVHDIYWQLEGDLFEPCLKHLLPQLQSFIVCIPRDSHGMSDSRKAFAAFINFIDQARIADMSCLRRLVLPKVAFDCLMRTTGTQSTRMQSVLAGLRSLGIGHNGIRRSYGIGHGSNARICIGPAALGFVSRNCGQLSQLQVVVCGQFRAYLAAFRALPSLTSLDLWVLKAELSGLTFDGSGAISSVLDFRIACTAYYTYFNRTNIFKIATFFPNARSVAVKASNTPDPLELATWLFGERQLFPAIAKLSCFFRPGGSLERCTCPTELLTQFLANPHLPEAVDLSQIDFSILARDANVLTAIFCAMQASSIKSLSLSGPAGREALPHLQDHIDLNGENAKVSAWKDRDLCDQPGFWDITEISQQTDFQIIGLKTSGNLKGEQFSIRIFHQLAKRADIF